MNQAPTRKTICKAQRKNWWMVKMTTIENALARGEDIHGFTWSTKKQWKKVARARRVFRHLEQSRARQRAIIQNRMEEISELQKG